MPTVSKMRRVMELKNVFMKPASGTLYNRSPKYPAGTVPELGIDYPGSQIFPQRDNDAADRFFIEFDPFSYVLVMPPQSCCSKRRRARSVIRVKLSLYFRNPS